MPIGIAPGRGRRASGRRYRNRSTTQPQCTNSVIQLLRSSSSLVRFSARKADFAHERQKIQGRYTKAAHADAPPSIPMLGSFLERAGGWAFLEPTGRRASVLGRRPQWSSGRFWRRREAPCGTTLRGRRRVHETSCRHESTGGPAEPGEPTSPFDGQAHGRPPARPFAARQWTRLQVRGLCQDAAAAYSSQLTLDLVLALKFNTNDERKKLRRARARLLGLQVGSSNSCFVVLVHGGYTDGPLHRRCKGPDKSGACTTTATARGLFVCRRVQGSERDVCLVLYQRASVVALRRSRRHPPTGGLRSATTRREDTESSDSDDENPPPPPPPRAEDDRGGKRRKKGRAERAAAAAADDALRPGRFARPVRRGCAERRRPGHVRARNRGARREARRDRRRLAREQPSCTRRRGDDAFSIASRAGGAPGAGPRDAARQKDGLGFEPTNATPLDGRFYI